jgi:hypothetical protein
MSIRAINWVIEAFVETSPKRVSPTMRHILMILANFAGDEDSSYPKQNTIARITGLSRVAVNKNLSLMEEMGLITAVGRTHANGATRSSEYTLHIDASNKYDGPAPEDDGVNDDDTGGVNQDDRGVTFDDSGCNPGLQAGVSDDDTYKNHHLDPPPEPKQEPRRKPRRTAWPSDYRDQFYNLYPKKVTRKDTHAKLDKIYAEDKVEFETIMDGLKRYIASRKDEDLKFMMAPVVFLNGERWEDEYGKGGRPPSSPPRRGYAI